MAAVGESRYVLEIEGDDGQLVGMVHEPAGEPRSAIVLAPSGLQPRAGLNRCYVRLATDLARRGHRVVRCDLTGLGEADGDIGEAVLFDQWDRVERGLFVADFRRVIAAARPSDDVPLVVAGVCGGGITAIFAADTDPGIAAVVAIGIPVKRTRGRVPPGVARGNYVRRARREIARRRVKTAGATYKKAMRYMLYAVAPRDPRRSTRDAWLNVPVVDALRRLYRANRPVSLIYGSNDTARDEPQLFLLKPYGLVEGARLACPILDDLAHSLDSPDQVDRLADEIDAWLARVLPPHSG